MDIRRVGLIASVALNACLVIGVVAMSMQSTPVASGMVKAGTKLTSNAIAGVRAASKKVSVEQGRALLNSSPNKATLLKMGALTNRLQQQGMSMNEIATGVTCQRIGGSACQEWYGPDRALWLG
eukprot:CAMPEP_0170177488 /NCGR_PEP_ID=MMETSP0040_2-20121228/10160_1 /TAXON_ID=641309 /ORGANISM="Lotharella oceanica, Strain CCMP622" /LENGTH=123 /DNA_ID=CAMNT_0010420139 /DNA_START=29 /DNA_END=396 /DNA_ORIENTATION=+